MIIYFDGKRASDATQHPFMTKRETLPHHNKGQI